MTVLGNITLIFDEEMYVLSFFNPNFTDLCKLLDSRNFIMGVDY